MASVVRSSLHSARTTSATRAARARIRQLTDARADERNATDRIVRLCPADSFARTMLDQVRSDDRSSRSPMASIDDPMRWRWSLLHMRRPSDAG